MAKTLLEILGNPRYTSINTGSAVSLYSNDTLVAHFAGDRDLLGYAMRYTVDALRLTGVNVGWVLNSNETFDLHVGDKFVSTIHTLDDLMVILSRTLPDGSCYSNNPPATVMDISTAPAHYGVF